MASMKALDPNVAVCPTRASFDIYGRQAPFSSLQAYTDGNCFSAGDRIEVENKVSRPQYSAYLNIGGITGTSNFNPRYQNDNSDTMGVYRNQAFGRDGRQVLVENPGFNSLAEEVQYTSEAFNTKNVGIIRGVN